jgi:hypothetical protein
MKRVAFALVLFVVSYSAYAIGEGDVIAMSTDAVVDPGLPFTYRVSYQHFISTATTITIDLPPGFVFVGTNGPCGLREEGHFVCQALPGTHGFTITVMAPDGLDGGTFIAKATLSGASSFVPPTIVARTFVVDNTNDDGAGSLRTAIENANARCTDGFPCKVAFRLSAMTDSGYHTIRLRSGLPAITTDSLAIDGTTQTRKIGDTNPDGPEIFIDGSDVKSGNGFTFTSCAPGVSGLTIGNFPDAGVRLLHAECGVGVTTISDSYIGVDATGLHAAPNERGIVVDQRTVTIANDLISANRRSGIFLVDRRPSPNLPQPADSRVTGNTIGIDRNHQPLGNGACGVYIDGNAVVQGNYIAFNHEQGISIAHTTDLVDVETNSIFANGQIGIDIGIDGPSFSFRPAILSARYDAGTNQTVIDLISIATSGGAVPDYHIYASDAPHPSGYGDGQYFLGVFFLPANGQVLTFRAVGDWRGKWVSATQGNRTFINGGVVVQTSEFGRAVKVE